MGQNDIRTLSSLLPSKVIKAQRGLGSFVTLDVEQISNHNANRRSSIHFWIYLCAWRLFEGTVCLLDSSDTDDAKFEQILSALVGLELLDIEEAEENQLTFYFAEEKSLQLQADLSEYEPEDDLLIVYLNEEETISYNTAEGFYAE